jgi:endonuclease III
VDTHNIRLAGRLGLSDQKTADKIERDLMEIVPKKRLGNVQPLDNLARAADLQS